MGANITHGYVHRPNQRAAAFRWPAKSQGCKKLWFTSQRECESVTSRWSVLTKLVTSNAQESVCTSNLWGRRRLRLISLDFGLLLFRILGVFDSRWREREKERYVFAVERERLRGKKRGPHRCQPQHGSCRLRCRPMEQPLHRHRPSSPSLKGGCWCRPVGGQRSIIPKTEPDVCARAEWGK